ncbi:MAG TPA: PhoH family protein [Eubacteriales bacterium]|mgnify:CR=1 FL=1|nr:PhoH family protein [Eubacteriales bacterium]
MAEITKKIDVNDVDALMKIFGALDENITIIKNAFNVEVLNLLGENYLKGEEENVNAALTVVEKLSKFIHNGDTIDVGRVKYMCDCAQEGKLDEIDDLLHGIVILTNRGKPIKCKTVGQKKYVDSIAKKTITIGVGPAGTGKTYLAVALAVNALRAKQVDKIILTRPAVEAGEKLGFLPGDLQEKVNPYLRPLYDGLQEMLGFEQYQKLIEKGVIEIAPLAYMRGRTLSNAFIILDEAQNTSREQIKMFLTRLGEGSKMVINGDLTQADLPEGKLSGLKHAATLLRDIPDIGIITLTEKDVVRHPLVQLIVKAYEAAEKNRRNNEK